MGNQWLKDYVSHGTGERMNFPPPASLNTQPRSDWPPAATHGGAPPRASQSIHRHLQGWCRAGSNVAQIVMGVVAISAFVSLSRPHVEYIPQPPLTEQANLSALEVERFHDEDAGLEYVKRRTPGAEELYWNWNRGGANRFVVGSHTSSNSLYYAPVPRRGFETLFKDLQGRGLAKLKLYTISVPLSWPPDVVEANVYKWAARCGTNEESIQQWSSYRDKSGHLVNDCVSGGTCIIVSLDCAGNAFDDRTATYKFE